MYKVSLISSNTSQFMEGNVERKLIFCVYLRLRWSVLLPLSWVRVFWNSIVSKGAHAIGLREKHWIACNVSMCTLELQF